MHLIHLDFVDVADSTTILEAKIPLGLYEENIYNNTRKASAHEGSAD